MVRYAVVALGGGIGAAARHGVNVLFSRVLDRPVPYATASVNVAGCLAIGILAGLLSGGHLRMGNTMRLFVFVGVLGGFTTFSSFALDTLTLVHQGRAGQALANVVGQVAIGLGCTLLGYWLASSR